MKKVIMC